MVLRLKNFDIAVYGLGWSRASSSCILILWFGPFLEFHLDDIFTETTKFLWF